MLLLATLRTIDRDVKPDLLPPPKWATDAAPPRFSTPRAINQLRAEVWGRALGVSNFSAFATQSALTAKPEKFAPDLRSAVLYAVN
jgi:diketogulonate reductase-like aldo/keto reductase